MNRRVFEESVSDLTQQLSNTLEVFMRERSLPFDRLRFEEQTSVDIADLAREAHFYGSDVFPDD